MPAIQLPVTDKSVARKVLVARLKYISIILYVMHSKLSVHDL